MPIEVVIDNTVRDGYYLLDGTKYRINPTKDHDMDCYQLVSWALSPIFKMNIDTYNNTLPVLVAYIQAYAKIYKIYIDNRTIEIDNDIPDFKFGYSGGVLFTKGLRHDNFYGHNDSRSFSMNIDTYNNLKREFGP